jgi:hypothetical protein
MFHNYEFDIIASCMFDLTMTDYIVACPLKARIMEPEEKAGKHYYFFNSFISNQNYLDSIS